MEKSCRKYVPKAIPRPLFIFVNNPKQRNYARNYFKNQKWDCQNPLKKLTLFFLLNPALFNGQSYQKQGPRTSDSRSSGYETSSQ